MGQKRSIYLRERTDSKLADLALALGVSKSAVITRLVDSHYVSMLSMRDSELRRESRARERVLGIPTNYQLGE